MSIDKGRIPCRLKALHAVYVSNLHRSLKDVALAHAWFADDDGANVWPAIDVIAAMVECDVKTIRHARRVLEHLNVLVPDDAVTLLGGRSKTRHYRFDFAALAAVKPGHPRPRFYCKKPGHPRPGLTAENPGAGHQKPGRSAPETRAIGTETRAPAPADLNDPSGTIREQTVADAPAHGPVALVPPFKVYAAIATRALDESLREDKTDDQGNVTERFKVLCVKQGLPYSGDISRRAVEAALAARSKAKGQFLSAYQSVLSGKKAARA